MSVRNGPGAISLTRTPQLAHSFAITSVSAWSAAFDEQYRPRPGAGTERAGRDHVDDHAAAVGRACARRSATRATSARACWSRTSSGTARGSTRRAACPATSPRCSRRCRRGRTRRRPRRRARRSGRCARRGSRRRARAARAPRSPRAAASQFSTLRLATTTSAPAPAKPERDGLAEPAPAAGDDRGLAGEVEEIPLATCAGPYAARRDRRPPLLPPAARGPRLRGRRSDRAADGQLRLPRRRPRDRRSGRDRSRLRRARARRHHRRRRPAPHRRARHALPPRSRGR